jgi:hypothetical protein
VLIRGDCGGAVDVRPVRWQFPPGAGAWDDRWLVIDGTVDLGGEAWSFTDPCLLIDEARELALWLRTAARHRIASLSFTEPVLGFSVVAPRDDERVLHVEFAAEAAPPWLRAGKRYTAELRIRPGDLLATATAWSRELDALPGRTFAGTE